MMAVDMIRPGELETRYAYCREKVSYVNCLRVFIHACVAKKARECQTFSVTVLGALRPHPAKTAFVAVM